MSTNKEPTKEEWEAYNRWRHNSRPEDIIYSVYEWLERRTEIDTK